ncbi:tubby-like F-box protein 3 [Durio zibethinus]|uniref:Tubby-like F-box protein 3 n=1 Tax=Durio zibethinus TaxID=66656 RepID=A0A6P6B1G8_DURZI|nr:tubby-like F-box protein 3 [Durio zibethinus]XP_022771014.1 tubby-like F-box protein 3 [Durio zibethinus]XP_022771015.1 tubby-like F-box protein 3 [Durio zibethinus]XP_022771016.1 tubby-like F-box protein 3 [Durio zibethinus]XP_022771017.1 tubby-like F-box protein 3 [Durio zibethinus]XP_022771018.1 tubby-like F-box protein 3 [Durio zibethinus]XP_022771019.1 tubby-like F-box protein 3 [Durio zibethinus]XP_022771020.1 tubby-like F-box protein 3 [Durio zibethinus]
MSFRSIILDMKGELGSISRKGFDVKFGYGMRSRSHGVVQDSSVPVDAFKQSCWATMPPELLRDVLMRIEASESTWPPRKNVVTCAGVCKNWREIMKEIVKTPEISGKLTFPISLKQPGPRDSLLQCYIKRNRSNQTYYLYIGLNQASNDDGKFLLAARKCRRPTCTDYIISLNGDDVSKGSSAYIGKLRSNFLGTKFTIYDAQPPNAGAKVIKSRSTRPINAKQVSPRVPAGNYPVAHISYELNVLGSRGPRRMQCIMDAIPASSIEPGGIAPTQTEFLHSNLDTFPSLPFFRSKSTRPESFQSRPLSGQKDGMLVLRNKAPRWHEQLQCWCLNFNGRVTVASVKNFQLVASLESGIAGQEHEIVILQFGKVGKDVFTMDYQYPISAFQAFAICLSSFDTKIACE